MMRGQKFERFIAHGQYNGTLQFRLRITEQQLVPGPVRRYTAFNWESAAAVARIEALASLPAADIDGNTEPTKIACNGKAVFPASQKNDGARDIQGFDIELRLRVITPFVRVSSERGMIGGVPLGSCLRTYQYILPD